MKRIFDSSKTLTYHLVRSNSKPRRPYSRNFSSNVKKPSKLSNLVTPNVKCHMSVATIEGRNNLDAELNESKNNTPDKLNWYWNLDEEHKRKISDPRYVRQAVQDTFMQRAQGGYNYKRTGILRNSSSAKSTRSGIHQKLEFTTKATKAKSAKLPPPSPNRPIPKPQVPNRKRIIDTAKPMYLRPKFQPGQRRNKSGVHLKEAGKKQLEEAKKKLYHPTPAVLDYMVEKHAPTINGLQNKVRKDKAGTELPRPIPSLVQTVFGWNRKEEANKNESDISITPRSIEVTKKLVGQKTNKKSSEVGTDKRRIQHAGRAGRDYRGSAKKKTPEADKKTREATEVKEKSARRSQAEEDRVAIWNKMKASSAPAIRTSREVTSVKKQVRDFDLTPQIYPKGSLTMKKSYLPITACRPRSDVGQPTQSHTSVYALKQEEKQLSPVKESTSFTDHIMDSLKNIFSKMRRNSA